MEETVQVDLQVYVLCNCEGEWFRRQSYGDYGSTWVSDIKRAWIYFDFSDVRSQLVLFADKCSEDEMPHIVKFQVKSGVVLDDTDWVKTEKRSRDEAKLKSDIELGNTELALARKRLADIQRRMKELGIEYEDK